MRSLCIGKLKVQPHKWSVDSLVVGRVYAYFALHRKIRTQFQTQAEKKPKSNFTFDQLIDKNVYVPDNGRSARVIGLFLTRDLRCTAWAGELRMGIAEQA